ncbi:hypothetical protein JKF63_06777 [Porcisia hertigi]|uniref:Protein kinase domain-containing protein n=1 Tax=Porcisia hertigi TaxID=2761500 RepID=A0A836LG71_9TRYP|nr:hypothetical protein JKF63_06777 [Porcisia hertigi]
MTTPFSPSNSFLPAPVTKKRVISSPRTAHDLSLRLGNDGLRGSHSGMVSPLTELLACSPSHLQLLSNDMVLSPSSWDSRGGDGTTQLLHPAREPARVPVALDSTSAGISRPARHNNNTGCSSPQFAPAHPEAEPVVTDSTANWPAPYSGKLSGSITMSRTATDKLAPIPKQDILSFSGTVSTTSSASRGGWRITAPTSLQRVAPREDGIPASIAFGDLASNPVTGDKAVAEHDIPHVRRAQQETRWCTAGVSGSAGTGASASASTGTSGTGMRTVDTYGLPNALLVGGGSSNGTTPNSPSTTMVSPHSRSTLAAPPLTTSLQLTTGNYNSNAAGSAGLNTQPNNISAFPPSNRSQDGAGVQVRTPRLASHLFLDDGPVVDSVWPPASLQSPAVRDGKRRNGLRNATDRLSVAALDQSRTPLCSVEGPVSLSEESYALTGLSLSSDMSRPTAANFVRGELIGKGSYGAVYRGMLRNNNRIIAMKEIRLPDAMEQQIRQSEKLPPPVSLPADSTLSPVLQASSSLKEKRSLAREVDAVRRELRLLKQLRHPNIVSYLNDEVVDGTLRIYMEYVSGGSVTAALKSYGSFEEPQAAALCFQLLQGLAYMHRNGIIHRDLKGDNLLLETSSQLKIADLGTAKNISSTTTMTASIVGTAYFMAPEVLHPDVAAVGTAADIWSVACCVIEMLTGKPPLSELPNQFTVMMAIGGSAAVPLDKYIPSPNTWSKEVLDFISQCLRVNPADRPTANDLLHHSWFAKLLNVTHVPSVESTSATLNSFPTPTVPSIERPLHLGPHRNLISPTYSPDLTAALARGYSGTQGDLGPPGSHTSSRASSHTSRGRKGKKEKRNSSWRHGHHSTSGITSATSQRSQESSQVSTPKNGSGIRMCDGSPQSGSMMRAHSPPVKQRGSHTKRRHHVPNLCHGIVVDDTQQSSGAESAMHPRTFIPIGAGDSHEENKGKGAFLPVITPSGGLVPLLCGDSLDGMRGGRSVKNNGSSREPTRAYLSALDAENTSRDPAHFGQCPSDHQQSFSRDFAESTVPYGSVARASVDGGSSTRSAGCHSMARDLESSGRRPLPPKIALPPSNSSKHPHGSLGGTL